MLDVLPTNARHRDIGTAEAVLGKDLSTPLQLPW